MSAELVVFLGPSLPLAEAKRLAPKARFLPPARQGDVWRVLEGRPKAIALIDGVFESTPSVWHHELLAAMDAGIALFGASSMGALRAAELWQQGMLGVGIVFAWLRDGVVEDDSEVALLHADGEHDYRAFTLPLVNVRYAAEKARAAKVLSPKEAAVLVSAAAEIFYQERTQPRLLETVSKLWRPKTHESFARWSKAGWPDLKAEDARECLRTAHGFVKTRSPAPARATHHAPSSMVRRRRLVEGSDENAQRLEKLRARPDADAVAELGVMRLLLAGWARGLGLRADPSEIAALRAELAPLLKRSGLDEAECHRHCEDLVLARRMVEHAPRIIPDGPHFDEGLAFEARTRGWWKAR